MRFLRWEVISESTESDLNRHIHLHLARNYEHLTYDHLSAWSLVWPSFDMHRDHFIRAMIISYAPARSWSFHVLAQSWLFLRSHKSLITSLGVSVNMPPLLSIPNDMDYISIWANYFLSNNFLILRFILFNEQCWTFYSIHWTFMITDGMGTFD